MTSTERYRNDPEYRRQVIASNRHNHYNNMASETYRKLRKVRQTVWSVNESIAIFRAKIKRLQQRLKTLGRRKEELEIAFGKERAERKRNGTQQARTTATT